MVSTSDEFPVPRRSQQRSNEKSDRLVDEFVGLGGLLGDGVD